MSPSTLRKWLAIGSGVGIEIGGEDLNVAVVRARPSGTRVLGTLSLHRFREEPAAEWGAVYASFLSKLGVGRLAATVLLPREDVIVRLATFPGVAAKDLDSALAYQIDSLHPYSEGEAGYGWGRVPGSGAVLVGIARHEAIRRYVTLFAEAGVKVAAFSFSAAAVHSALRMYSTPPAEGFVAIEERTGELEIYGESPARPVFSARLDPPADRARAFALAELRLDPETAPVTLPDLLPAPAALPADADFSAVSMAYVAALAGACPWLALGANLLPKEARQTSSRAHFVPTAALAAVILLLVGALSASGPIGNRRYLDALHGRIHALEPAAARSAALDRSIAGARARTAALDAFRKRSKDDLDALNEMTRLLAPPTWLRSLEMNRKEITIAGETDQAAALLRVLDGSGHFHDSEFTTPLQRAPQGESFSIRTQRKEGPR